MRGLLLRSMILEIVAVIETKTNIGKREYQYKDESKHIHRGFHIRSKSHQINHNKHKNCLNQSYDQVGENLAEHEVSRCRRCDTNSFHHPIFSVFCEGSRNNHYKEDGGEGEHAWCQEIEA